MFLLTQPVCSSDSLLIMYRIPSKVEENNPVRRCDVQTERTGFARNQEDSAVPLIEFINQVLSPLDDGFSRQLKDTVTFMQQLALEELQGGYGMYEDKNIVIEFDRFLHN